MCLRLCRHSDNVPELSDLIKQTFSFVCIESELLSEVCLNFMYQFKPLFFVSIFIDTQDP